MKRREKGDNETWMEEEVRWEGGAEGRCRSQTGEKIYVHINLPSSGPVCDAVFIPSSLFLASYFLCLRRC